jgi:molecular chaperone DnaJ
MATKRDYYQILGVDRGASDEEIKRAFRKAAQQHHPDVDKTDGAEGRFKELNEAYRVLSDRQRRSAYDMFGHAGVDGASAGGGEGFGGGFGPFGDIFDAFFGGAPGQTRRRGRPEAGSDLRYDLSISLAEVVTGVVREISFPALGRCATCEGTGAEPGSQPERCPECSGTGERRRVSQTILGQMVNITACPRCHGEGKLVGTPCHTCRGEGRTRGDRKLQVTIPAGIESGQRIALEGQGESGPRGGPNGDLYVVVAVTEQAGLVRRGTELYTELPLTVAQAALGAKITVQTVDGSEEVTIPAGVQSGQEIRLKGRGLPRLRSANRGDLHVLAAVVVPAKLTKRERELYRELGELSGAATLPKGSPSLADRLRDFLG